jgi:hypothetical protein
VAEEYRHQLAKDRQDQNYIEDVEDVKVAFEQRGVFL